MISSSDISNGIIKNELRGSSGKSRHPGLKHAPPELEGIFADNGEVNQLQDCELVEEDPENYGDDKHGQLGHD